MSNFTYAGNFKAKCKVKKHREFLGNGSKLNKYITHSVNLNIQIKGLESGFGVREE